MPRCAINLWRLLYAAGKIEKGSHYSVDCTRRDDWRDFSFLAGLYLRSSTGDFLLADTTNLLRLDHFPDYHIQVCRRSTQVV